MTKGRPIQGIAGLTHQADSRPLEVGVGSALSFSGPGLYSVLLPLGFTFGFTDIERVESLYTGTSDHDPVINVLFA